MYTFDVVVITLVVEAALYVFWQWLMIPMESDEL